MLLNCRVLLWGSSVSPWTPTVVPPPPGGPGHIHAWAGAGGRASRTGRAAEHLSCSWRPHVGHIEEGTGELRRDTPPTVQLPGLLRWGRQHHGHF